MEPNENKSVFDKDTQKQMRKEKMRMMREQSNTKEPAHINLIIRDDCDPLSPYSEPGKPVITSDIADFIMNASLAHNYKSEYITTIKCKADKKKQQVYDTAIRNYFAHQWLDLDRELKRSLWTSMLFMLIGIAILAFKIAFNITDAVAPITQDILEIFAWVFLWAALDTLCIQMVNVNVRKRRLENLVFMEINFIDSTTTTKK